MFWKDFVVEYKICFKCINTYVIRKKKNAKQNKIKQTINSLMT